MRFLNQAFCRAAGACVLALSNFQIANAHGGVFPGPLPSFGAPAGATASGPSRPPAGLGGRAGNSPGGGPRPQLGGINKNPSAPSTGGPGVSTAVDFVEWGWWWSFNREPYLALKDHIRSRSTFTGTRDFFLGRGDEPSAQATGQVFAFEHVLPALLETLDRKSKRERSNDELTASMIALAKLIHGAPEDQRGELSKWRAVLGSHLDQKNQEVAETAVIALGIAGGRRSSLLLGNLLADNEAGRALLGKSSVPERTRAFAAYALALVGAQHSNEDLRRLIVHHLAQGLDNAQARSADVQVACVIALGRVSLKLEAEHKSAPKQARSASTSLQAQVRYLITHLEEEKLLPQALAQIPTSLGFLLPAEAIEHAPALKQELGGALLKVVKPGARAARELQQSTMIALGMIGDDDLDPLDVQIRELLGEAWTRFKDQHTRHMATIALAEISTRRGTGIHTKTHGAQDILIKKMSSRRNDEQRWAALALGIHGSARTPSGYSQDAVNSTKTIARVLSDALREAKAPIDVGALATAIGILGSPEGADQIRRKLTSIKEERSLGHVAVAAGLLKLKDTVPALHSWIQSTSYRIFLTQELAIALALVEDRSVAPMLMQRLQDAQSLTAQATLAQALGRVGDVQTLAPLLKLYRDPLVSARARAFAAVALGIVADQARLPWNTIFKLHLNYAAVPETLFDQRGYGVLNIL